MILTGPKIQEEVLSGKIILDPFDAIQINPNSYDVRLGRTLKVYKEHVLDTRIKNETEIITIPDEGMILYPHRLYLGHTIERFGSNDYVPIIRGKSSTGRLGLFIHITADLIDIGSIGTSTLMFHAVQPVRIIPRMRIAQVTFWRVYGDIILYEGKYQGSFEPHESQTYKDFETGMLA